MYVRACYAAEEFVFPFNYSEPLQTTKPSDSKRVWTFCFGRVTFALTLTAVSPFKVELDSEPGTIF